MSSRWRDRLETLDRWARRLENGAIVLLLSTLILLGSSQVVLRNVFSMSLASGDALVRLLVLWLALVGAVAASRDGRQIRIDVLSRLLPKKLIWITDGIATAFTAVVCGLLAWQSARFVLDSRAYGDLLLDDWPAWILQIILPVGFALIGYRYAIRTVATLNRRQ